MGLLDNLGLGDVLKGALGQVEGRRCRRSSTACWRRPSTTISTASLPPCKAAASAARSNRGLVPVPICRSPRISSRPYSATAQVQEFASHLGLPVDQTLKLLAQYLPDIVDKASPNGILKPAA